MFFSAPLRLRVEDLNFHCAASRYFGCDVCHFERQGARNSPQRRGDAKQANFLWIQAESGYFIGMKALQIEYPESWPAAAGLSAERFEGEARMGHEAV